LNHARNESVDDEMVCPGWRRLYKGKYTTDSCNAIFNDFFESIIVVIVGMLLRLKYNLSNARRKNRES